MWTYEQSTGIVRDENGTIQGIGWAGNGPGLNNPDFESVRNVGPLPKGFYTIGTPYDHTPENGYPRNLGPYVMNLTPDDSNEMYGRGDFRIHGAAITNPDMSSDGCIVQARPARERIWNGNLDHRLQVI